MKPPRRLSGSAPLVDWLNQLLDYVKSLELRESNDVRIKRTTTGTIIEVKAGEGTGGSNIPRWG